MKTLLNKKNILLFIAAFFLVSIAIPLLHPKYPAGFTGIEREAAQSAISSAWEMNSGINYISNLGTIKIVAENVEIDKSESQLCQGEFHYPEGEGKYFLVDLSYRAFFGIEIESYQLRICRIF